MSGTAFNGSPWVTGVEMAALAVFSFGGAALGASLYGAGLKRNIDAEIEAELEKDTAKRSRRRRAPASTEASIISEVEELAFPMVVEDPSENGKPTS